MEPAFWDRVVAEGRTVPADRPLVDLTAELTAMLGAVDPHLREGIAYPMLAAWVTGGVYDDLLAGLGDGMAVGLAVGIGEEGTDTVFRRCLSVRVLTTCVARATRTAALADDTLLGWGDRVAGWLVRERDLRGFAPGKGWAHALAHGADALGVLARSPVLGHLELTVLLDVVADRVLTPTRTRFAHAEEDRLALATMAILRRDLVRLDVLEPWVARLAEHAGTAVDSTEDPSPVPGNVQAFLRALHLQLALASRPPACRPDLLLTLIEHLRAANPRYLS